MGLALEQWSERDAHVEGRVRAFSIANMQRGLHFATYINLAFILHLGSVFYYGWINLPNVGLLLAGHLLLQMEIHASKCLLRKNFFYGCVCIYLALTTVYGTYFLANFYNLRTGAPTIILLTSVCLLLAANIGFILLNPLVTLKSQLVVAVLLSLSTMLLFAPHGLLIVALINIVLIFGMVAAVDTTTTNIRKGAAHDFEQQRLTAQIKSLEREKDLDLAREIQDSMAPSEGINDQRIRIGHFQEKHYKVAGDWQAAHKMEDGTVVAVIADATGKGVQAALTVRAVQTLWVDATGGRSFRPVEWLGKVNRILYALGYKRPQTVTVGLVSITSDAIIYYSLGHVPLFILVENESGSYVQCLAARGNMLGISARINFEPKHLRIEPKTIYTVFLGSDGVFSGGSRYRLHELRSLLEALEKNPQSAMRKIEVADDKSLILLRVA